MKFNTQIEELDTIEIINSKYINWKFFENSSILITGATGLIGYQIVLALLYANEILNTNITIYALVRNKEKAESKFKNNLSDKLHFVVQDIVDEINCPNVDFIVHTANSTASKYMVENPVEMIDSIITGTKNILEYAKRANIKSATYLSSMEIYGFNPIETAKPLKETDYGYIDVMNVRNSYPIGKIMAENMCLAYYSEYNVPFKIARLSQIIGAGIDYNDNRVFAQFARNITEKKDIVLHTEGKTTRSYCYITDCISAIFTLLEKGHNGESYNVTNTDAVCSIKEMAQMLCNKYSDSKLNMDLDNINNKYYLPTTKTVLSTEKIKSLNWNAIINIDVMFERLVKSLEYQRGYDE